MNKVLPLFRNGSHLCDAQVLDEQPPTRAQTRVPVMGGGTVTGRGKVHPGRILLRLPMQASMSLMGGGHAVLVLVRDNNQGLRLHVENISNNTVTALYEEFELKTDAAQ